MIHVRVTRINSRARVHKLQLNNAPFFPTDVQLYMGMCTYVCTYVCTTTAPLIAAKNLRSEPATPAELFFQRRHHRGSKEISNAEN